MYEKYLSIPTMKIKFTCKSFVLTKCFHIKKPKEFKLILYVNLVVYCIILKYLIYFSMKIIETITSLINTEMITTILSQQS